MLTPVGVTSSDYWDAIKQGNATHVKMEFTGQGITLTDDDIEYNKGLTINDIINGDTDLVPGRAVAKQITVGILNTSKVDDLVWTSEFVLSLGVEINSVTNWVTIGTFIGEKPNHLNTAQVVDFVAYDRMQRFDVLADNFVQTITYPVTLDTLYGNLCTYVGVAKVSGSELPTIKNRSFSSAPCDFNGYTLRDILAWIAEAYGCYAKINASGNCQMVWYTDNTSHAVVPDNEFYAESADIDDGLTWDEAEAYTLDEIETMIWNDVSGYEEALRIDEMIVEQIDSGITVHYPAAYGGNVYTITGNPFLKVSSVSDVTNYLKPIYDRMYAFGGYLPFNVDTIGCWLVEAGDIVTVTINSQTFTAPIFSRTLHWNGSVMDNYETTGNNVREAYSNSYDKQASYTEKRIKLFVGGNYYKVRSGIDIEEEGVTVSGGKFVKIQSGGIFTVESDNFTVDSNGNVYMKGSAPVLRKGLRSEPLRDTPQTGGSFTTESGNFSIDPSGNVEMKGNVEISAGKNMTVKSGGNLNVESGGSIDINASGTLKLTGSDVSIKSGSTFDVESINFKLNSTDKFLQTGEWKIYSDGLVKKEYDSYLHEYIGVAFGDYSAFIQENHEVIGFTSSIANGADYDHGFSYLTMKYTDNSFGRIVFEVDAEKAIISSETGVLGISGVTGIPGQLGTYNGTWDIYGDTVRYVTLVNVSSKDVKHDIKPLYDFGEKIDKLQPVSFIYDNDKNEKTRYGLIYEDAIDVMPEICTDDESDKAINYVELIPVLLKEIQSLRTRVKLLEERGVN